MGNAVGVDWTPTVFAGGASAISLAAWLLFRRSRAHRLRAAADAADAAGPAAPPDISVPEALHTLVHGPRASRAQAARALVEILCGEVEVLEEILDEALGTHPEFGGDKRSDGRGILRMVLDDLAEQDSDSEAFADLLLQCTSYDEEWQDDDEWNTLTTKFIDHIRDKEGADARLLKAQKQHGDGPLASKLGVLQARLRGDREEAAECGGADGTPGMLSMNTRMFCPVCLTRCPEMLRCAQCQNVGYCGEEHLQADAARHRAWCFPWDGGDTSASKD